MVLGGAGDGVRLGVLQTGLPRPLLITPSEHFLISSRLEKILKEIITACTKN